MENNHNRDAAQNTAPQNDWRNAEDLVPTDASAINEFAEEEPTEYIEDAEEQPFYALSGNDDPDPDEEEEDDEEDDDEENEEDDDERGDWGHIDPAESNSPFPDPNAPTAPGSAV
eukprot:Opistho-1_new@97608